MSRRAVIALVAILAMLVAGGGVIFYQYTQSRDALIEAAERHLHQAVGDAVKEANRVFHTAVSTANQLHAADLRVQGSPRCTRRNTENLESRLT